ncbi:hypothetical protein F5Y05DRAFT_413325 [Hypoxylon sp. FL0543]|nr:hypothetical protein F5Y05DRAFT_413325 [Hypoxylon sp. FL0543]
MSQGAFRRGPQRPDYLESDDVFDPMYQPTLRSGLQHTTRPAQNPYGRSGFSSRYEEDVDSLGEESLYESEESEDEDDIRDMIEERMVRCCDACLDRRVALLNDVLSAYNYEERDELDDLLDRIELAEDDVVARYRQIRATNRHRLNYLTDKALYEEHFPEAGPFVAYVELTPADQASSRLSHLSRFEERQTLEHPYLAQRQPQVPSRPRRRASAQAMTPTSAAGELQQGQQSGRKKHGKRGKGRGRGSQRGTPSAQPRQPITPATPNIVSNAAVPPQQAAPQVGRVPSSLQPRSQTQTLPAAGSRRPTSDQPTVTGQTTQTAPAGNGPSKPTPNPPQSEAGFRGTRRAASGQPGSRGFSSTLTLRQVAWEKTRGPDAQAPDDCEPYVFRLPHWRFNWTICVGGLISTVEEKYPQIRVVTREAGEACPYHREFVLGFVGERDWQDPFMLYSLNHVYNRLVEYGTTLIEERHDIEFEQNLASQFQNMNRIDGATQNKGESVARYNARLIEMKSLDAQSFNGPRHLRAMSY